MKRSTKIIATILLIIGGSSTVYAFSKHNHWNMSPAEKAEFITERVTRKLDLDGLQQQNFGTLAELVSNILGDARSSKQQDLEEVKNLLQEPSFNQARALEMVQQKTQMINEKAPLVISQLAIFLDSLTIEQKQEMKSLLEHHRKHHRRHGDDK